jgi:hypothetical protein
MYAVGLQGDNPEIRYVGWLGLAYWLSGAAGLGAVMVALRWARVAGRHAALDGRDARVLRRDVRRDGAAEHAALGVARPIGARDVDVEARGAGGLRHPLNADALDLDPMPGASLEMVRDVARWIRDALVCVAPPARAGPAPARAEGDDLAVEHERCARPGALERLDDLGELRGLVVAEAAPDANVDVAVHGLHLDDPAHPVVFRLVGKARVGERDLLAPG